MKTLSPIILILLSLMLLNLQSCVPNEKKVTKNKNSTSLPNENTNHDDTNLPIPPTEDEDSTTGDLPPVNTTGERIDLIKPQFMGRDFNIFVNEEFKLFWYTPVRAYPGLKLSHQFIAYEVSNQPLQWDLIQSPSGMTIETSTGLLEWTPITSGVFNVQVRVTRLTGETISKSFSIRVNENEFLFVDSVNGLDTNNGSKNQALKTISEAMKKVKNQSKTIYIRSGRYQEYSGTSEFELSNTDIHTEDNPFIISTYPGDSPAVLDCKYKGWGFVLQGSFSVLQNMIVEHAFAPYEGAQVNPGAVRISGSNNILQNIVTQKNSWWLGQNMTGVLVQNALHSIIDRVSSVNNTPYDKENTSVNHASGGGFRDSSNYLFNASNFLFYTDGPTNNSNNYVLNSKSSGSIIGFKIKHSGPMGKFILHNIESDNDYIGFAGASDFSSVRYSIFKNNKISGIALGYTDIISGINPVPSQSYGQDIMLVEHNTILDTGGGFGIQLLGSYARNSWIVKNLIDQSSQTNSGMADYTGYFVSLFVEGNLDYLNLYSPVFHKNFYYKSSTSMSDTKSFKRYPYINLTPASWRSLTSKNSSLFDDGVVNNFNSPNFESDGVSLSTGSPAIYSDQEFAGAR